MTFCLDTNVAIWAIKRDGDRINDAVEFIDIADARGDRLLVPAVVVHEMLIESSAEQEARWVDALQNRIRVVPFDLQAARLGAYLETRYAQSRSTRKYRDRYDIQIVATAMRWRADAIVSLDEDIRKIAHDQIAVRGFEEPGTLFAD